MDSVILDARETALETKILALVEFTFGDEGRGERGRQ